MKELEKLCDCVGKIGELREALYQIDWGKIYSDPEKAARAGVDTLERARALIELQYDLLLIMSEV